MKEPTLSSLIIGPSGHGKSWFGSTTPPPRLILDLEGRAKYTPNGKDATLWDGRTPPMSLPRSPSRTYIVDLTEDIGALDLIHQWLRSGEHPFKSVTVDSLMEVQYQAAQSVVPGTKAFRTQDWGTLLREMEAFVRKMTDLLKYPSTKVRCMVFIAGCITRDGYQKPLMQGQITTKVPYWMDLVGYMEKVRMEGSGKTQRRLWIDQRPENDLEVKDGTDAIISAHGACIVLGERGEEPTFETLYDALVAAQKKETADGK